MNQSDDSDPTSQHDCVELHLPQPSLLHLDQSHACEEALPSEQASASLPRGDGSQEHQSTSTPLLQCLLRPLLLSTCDCLFAARLSVESLHQYGAPIQEYVRIESLQLFQDQSHVQHACGDFQVLLSKYESLKSLRVQLPNESS